VPPFFPWASARSWRTPSPRTFPFRQRDGARWLPLSPSFPLRSQKPTHGPSFFLPFAAGSIVRVRQGEFLSFSPCAPVQREEWRVSRIFFLFFNNTRKGEGWLFPSFSFLVDDPHGGRRDHVPPFPSFGAGRNYVLYSLQGEGVSSFSSVGDKVGEFFYHFPLLFLRQGHRKKHGVPYPPLFL